MPYRASIIKEVKATSPRCFLCNKKFKEHEYSVVHSGTGYHLELVESEDSEEKYSYKVTDPSDGHPEMLGQLIRIDEFPQFGHRYKADAVRLHANCHDKIHLLALQLCRKKIPDFTGSAPTPNLLAEATFNYHFYRSDGRYA